ncbi:class I SAM-dependent methyltransferase [Acidobacteriota bacterium]
MSKESCETNPSDFLAPSPEVLRDLLGNIDIYLFDQVLKGRFKPGMTILDAGCGEGRNIAFFLRCGFNVFAVDSSPKKIEKLRRMPAGLTSPLPPEHFRVGQVDALSFDDGSFDAVISNAVLHFASDEAQFRAMLLEMWRVLRPGGFLFCRLASSIGIEDRIEHLSGRRYSLPDGTDRFLVDEAMLLSLTGELEGRLLDPIKTVNVQNERCMTTWVVEKRG